MPGTKRVVWAAVCAATLSVSACSKEPDSPGTGTDGSGVMGQAGASTAGAAPVVSPPVTTPGMVGTGGSTTDPVPPPNTMPTMPSGGMGGSGMAMTPAGSGGAVEPMPMAGSMAAAGTMAMPMPAAPTEKFSFFVASLAALQQLSKSDDGFGGDLRFGETGPGAGLRGADKICATIADRSMPNASLKVWRAFLSATKGENGEQVNAIDRIGTGPWYDRKGRLLAMDKASLLHFRPSGDMAIINDFPNEDGVPNHDPDNTGAVDNHDTLTGTNAMGQLFGPMATCLDWTSKVGNAAMTGRPRVGHSWPRNAGMTGGTGGGFGGRGGFPGGGGGDGDGYGHWMSSLDEAGCAPSVRLDERGGPKEEDPSVGSGGGYGGIYCFALKP